MAVRSLAIIKFNWIKDTRVMSKYNNNFNPRLINICNNN